MFILYSEKNLFKKTSINSKEKRVVKTLYKEKDPVKLKILM